MQRYLGICLLVVASVACRDARSDEPAQDGGDAATRCSVDLRLDVVEAEELVQEVRCAEGGRLPAGAEPASLPPGAVFEASSSELHWTPRLDQAGVHVITLRDGGSSQASLGTLEISVLDAAFDAANVALDAPERYLTEYGLPVLHLGVSPEINDDAHAPASLVYQGHTYAGVSAKYRGSTSRKYPKRSYTLKFDGSDPFRDPANGLRRARRIVLTTTFDDNSYLRQRLAYALWNRLSDEHIAIHAFNAVVFVDGQYHGLYLVSDHIDDDFLDEAGVFGHGNLYKARKHDANFRTVDANGDPKPSLSAGYTKEEGTPVAPEPGAFADLEALVHWIATAPDDELARQLDERLIQTEFEDWWMFVGLIQATDSAGKNSYLYRDAREDAPEPRWRYLPWDFNASFGQGYRTQRRSSADYPPTEFGQYNELFARMLRDERLHARLQERFREALHGAWDRADVLALFDQWAAEIRPSALRDEQEWGAAYRDFGWGGRTDLTTHLEEARYVRGWIEERWSLIDADL